MYRVFLVDDEPIILEGLRLVIDWKGQDLEIVGQALDGVEALEKLIANPVDILITDIRMSNMDGLALIQKIRELDLNIKIIILSSYEEFGYVKQAARMGIEDYLLKPINEDELVNTLQTTIKKIDSELYRKVQKRLDENILRENIIFRWISNNIDERELNERVELLNINLDYEYFSTAVIKTLSVPIRGEYFRPTVDTTKMCNACAQSLHGIRNLCIFPDLNGYIVILFQWNGMELDKKSILSGLRQCIKGINRLFDLHVFTALGSIEKGYRSASKSYFRALGLLDYRLVTPPDSVMEFDGAKQLTAKGEKFKIDYSDLRHCVVAHKKEEIARTIDDVFEKIKKERDILPSTIKNISVELLLNIYAQNPEYAESIGGSDLYNRIADLDSLDELHQFVRSNAQKLLDLLISAQNETTPIIKRIIQYINGAFTSELSLKTLAATFNMNASYLGQLFKNEVGVPFSDYLNNYRIEKAKEMLMRSSLTACDISQKVGYSNPNYFYNVFKRYTGDYPTEYKRKRICGQLDTGSVPHEGDRQENFGPF